MYPTVSPPPTDTGALTWPRRLQKWLDVNPDTRLTRTSTFITLPAFTGNGQPWLGYSDIVTAFNYEGPNNLSLKAISSIPVNPNYVLCVSWRVGNILKRYLIWDAVGSVMPEGITTYTNQKVGKNFRFEVWSTSQGNATETNNINFYTSVLGKVDYRYGTDSQLVGADAQVTNFGALINSSVSLPTVDLVYHLDADVGVVSTGGYGTQLVSWTDSVSGVVFTPTGTINYDANGITTNGHSVVGITSGSTISGTGLGNNSGTIAIAFCFVAPGLTGSIIDNGGGVNAGYDDSINKFTSYTGGISNVTFPIDTTVYLMLLSPNSGLCTIVNMATGIVLDYFTSSDSPGPDDTITIGSVPMIVFEVAMYDADIGYTSSAFTQLAQYFTSKYYGAFNLPLTFPPNAVSVTN